MSVLKLVDNTINNVFRSFPKINKDIMKYLSKPNNEIKVNFNVNLNNYMFCHQEVLVFAFGIHKSTTFAPQSHCFCRWIIAYHQKQFTIAKIVRFNSRC